MITNGESIWATIGVDFAPLLNEAYLSGADTVTLIQDDSILYATFDTQIIQQQNDNIFNLTDSQDTRSTITFNNKDFKVSPLKSDTTCNQLTSMSINNSKKETTTRGVITTLRGKKSLPNYPIVEQGNYDLCWAAAIASMARYEMPTTYSRLSAKDVADDNDHDYTSADISFCLKSIKYYFQAPYYYPYIISRCLTPDEIKTVIDNDDPAFICASRRVSEFEFAYHAVAMMGYEFADDVTAIEIVDSTYTSRSKFCTFDSTNNWTFYSTKITYGDIIYTWIQTIALNAY